MSPGNLIVPHSEQSDSQYSAKSSYQRLYDKIKLSGFRPNGIIEELSENSENHTIAPVINDSKNQYLKVG